VQAQKSVSRPIGPVKRKVYCYPDTRVIVPVGSQATSKGSGMAQPDRSLNAGDDAFCCRVPARVGERAMRCVALGAHPFRAGNRHYSARKYAQQCGRFGIGRVSGVSGTAFGLAQESAHWD
jgi:hypothetical protein